MSSVQRLSAVNAAPAGAALTGRETIQEAEALEMQSLRAERDGNDAECIRLMERAMQIRSRLVTSIGEELQAAAGSAQEEYWYSEYASASNDLYACTERLIVKCNTHAVESFKKGDYETAAPLLQYSTELTEEGAYPLREDEERRRHLRGVTLNNLGCMHRRQGRFRDALNCLQASMDATGVESPVAYMNMSAILIQLRLSEEAASMAQRSIELLATTPEDPSLLAVAHHNLAMALEPVDPTRCLEEYRTAYETACATVGAQSPTTASIQRNWQRYERSQQPQPPGAVPPSRNFVALQPQSTPRKRGAGLTVPPLAIPPTGAPAAAVEDGTASDIFPHPFVSSHQSRPPAPPARGSIARLPAAPGPARPSKDVGGRRGPATAPVPLPLPPDRPRPAAAAVAAAATTAAPPAAPRRPQPVSGGAAGVAAPRRPEPLSRGVAPQASPVPPPSTRPSAAQDRLRRFTASRGGEEGAGVAQTVPAPGGKGKLSPLETREPPVRAAREANPVAALPPIKGAAGEGERPGVPRPPIEGRKGKPAGPTSSTGGAPPSAAVRHDASQPLSFAGASDVSQFEKKGGDLVGYIADRLDMLLHDEKEMERKYHTATTIQRHYRGHLARRRLQEVRDSHQREEKLRRLRRDRAARTIQRAYRQAAGRRRHFPGSHSRRGLSAPASSEHAAAVRIQSGARGWLARRAYRRRRHFQQEGRFAAERIQRWARCSLARRELARRRGARDAEVAAAAERERSFAAATRIQSLWRGHADRRRLHDERARRSEARAARVAAGEFAAARTIQCAWRSAAARARYQELLSHHRAREAQRAAYLQSRTAAIQLQAFARGIIARNRTGPALEQARHRAAAAVNRSRRTHTAAVVVQRAWRGHQARRERGELRAAHAAATHAARTAALVRLVQRVGRGCVERRRLGAEVAAMEREAARYHRELAKLTCMGAQRAAESPLRSTLEDEDDARAECELAEAKARRLLGAAWREMRQPGATGARGSAHARSASETLEGFAKVLRAKREVAARQAARDAYLAESDVSGAAAVEHEASATITRFMRMAAATQTARARRQSVEQYLAHLAATEAAGTSACTPENVWSGDSEEEESLAMKGPSSPPRPDSDMHLNGADHAAAPAAVEGAGEEYDSLEAALAAERAKRMAAKAEEQRLQKQREDLLMARQAYKLKQIGAATTTRELAPYTRQRISLSQSRRTPPAPAAGEVGAADSAAPARPSSREARERQSAEVIHRVYRGHQARQYARRVRSLRDEYLAALGDKEKVDGPILSVERVRQVAGSYPPPPFPRKPAVARPPVVPPLATVEQDHAPRSREVVLAGVVKVLEARREVAKRQAQVAEYLRTADEVHEQSCSPEALAKERAVLDQLNAKEAERVEGELLEVIAKREEAYLESERVLAGFARVIRAKKERAARLSCAAVNVEAMVERDQAEAVAVAPPPVAAAPPATAVHSAPPVAERNVAPEPEAIQTPLQPEPADSTEEPALRTPEQLAKERATLDQLNAREAERVESELLDAIAKREEAYLESERVLRGFARVIRAKKERAARLSCAAVHVEAMVKRDQAEAGTGAEPHSEGSTAVFDPVDIERDTSEETDAAASVVPFLATAAPPVTVSVSAMPADEASITALEIAAETADPCLAGGEGVFVEADALQALVLQKPATGKADPSPRTPDQLASERAALDELNAREVEELENELLVSISKREDVFLEAELVLRGFARVLGAKRERAARQARVAAHLDALERAAGDDPSRREPAAATRGVARRSCPAGAATAAEDLANSPARLAEEWAVSERRREEAQATAAEEEARQIAAERATLSRVATREQHLREAHALARLLAAEASLAAEAAAATADGEAGEGAGSAPDAAETAAAVAIQCSYRGWRARRELSARRDADRARLETELMAEELLNNAATDIQRVFRGFQGRRQAQARYEAYRGLVMGEDKEDQASSAESSDYMELAMASASTLPPPHGVGDDADARGVRPAGPHTGSTASSRSSMTTDSASGAPRGGLTGEAVDAAFPERYRELGDPPLTAAPEATSTAPGSCHSSGHNSTAIVEEVTSQHAPIEFDREI